MTAGRRKGAECEGVACEHALGQQPLQLYSYLWAKASNGGCKQSYSFVLTDTVVFKRHKPVKWLFSSMQERGKILCKTKKFLTTSRVLQEFLVPKWAANTLPKLDNDKQILATYAYLDRSSGFGEMHMVVEHLDKDALEYLLEEREKPGVSVLQRFIPTQSGYNHTVRSVYTSDSCIVQKCISPFLLSDTKASMAQRTATFEIDDPLLRHRDVTDKGVHKAIEVINGEMSMHLESIVGKEMVHFVNYFKIGADHRIYLLWSSTISFDAGSKGAAKSYSLSLGNHSTAISTIPTSVDDTEQQPPTTQSLIGCNAKLKVCPNCKRMLPRDQVEYVVTHRSIIRQFERDDVEKESDEEVESIPTLLRAISGPIQVERFKQLKQSATYLYQTVQLCLSCARQINVKPNVCISSGGDNHEHGKNNPEKLQGEAAHSEPRRSNLCGLGKQDDSRKAYKPVVVVTARAQSAGSMRMGFSKKNIKNGSYQYRQHLLRVLPRLNAFDAPDLPPRERVRQLAFHLRRTYGHPSLRFALSQCNVFPVGSMVPLRTLNGVCSTCLLLPVAQYWTELSQVEKCSISPQTIDIDAIDSLLAASLNPSHPVAHPAAEPPSQPRRRVVRPMHFIHATKASCHIIPKTPPTTICVPKRPDRPRSCIPTSSSSRRARLLSLTSAKPQQPLSNSENQLSDGTAVPLALLKIVDGIRCSVQASARTNSDGQCVLHLQVSKLPSASNQNEPVMELTLSTAEIIALLGSTCNMQHLTSQSALLEGILPLLQIRNAQLSIADPQHQLQTEETSQPTLNPDPPHRVHFQ